MILRMKQNLLYAQKIYLNTISILKKFQDRDPEGTDKISYEHFRDIYRIYEVKN